MNNYAYLRLLLLVGGHVEMIILVVISACLPKPNQGTAIAPIRCCKSKEVMYVNGITVEPSY
jgi:hypothetical protein